MAKVFLTGGRNLKLKNLALLQRAFALAQVTAPDIRLETVALDHEPFLRKISASYAVIVPSISEVSPNVVLDSLRLGRPVVLTQETGLRSRLGDAALWVDPQSEQDIAAKIVWLANPENYKKSLEQVSRFNFKHSWSEIATEFLKL